ncbi:MAG: hypothetical protein ACK46G_11895 [Flavobacteriales bacterium]|jgi:hypothetical protein
MNTSALVLMLCSMGTVTALTVYFFYRVLTAPPKPEPDSYSGNDEEPTAH